MENAPFSSEMERLITDEEKERLQRALASYGLFYADPTEITQLEHPQDDRWVLGYD